MKYIGTSVDDDFAAALDRAVVEHRRENPQRNASRSSFIKAALERAVEESGITLSPPVRMRHRAGASANPVSPAAR